MGWGTTPEQDRHYREVAAGFGFGTRTSVRRQLSRGRPPTDPALRPLALACLPKLEGATKKREWLPILMYAGPVLVLLGAVATAASGNQHETALDLLLCLWLAGTSTMFLLAQSRTRRGLAESRRKLEESESPRGESNP